MGNGVVTGVGSRGTPAMKNYFCYLVGRALARRGYVLWSGDCHGPDRAFYEGWSFECKTGSCASIWW